MTQRLPAIQPLQIRRLQPPFTGRSPRDAPRRRSDSSGLQRRQPTQQFPHG